MRLCLLDACSTDQGDPEIWAPLHPLASVVRHERSTVAEALARAQGCAGIIINKIPFGAAELAALPALRYVGLPSTGTNIIDLDAARARGIAVTNVPGYSTSAVAQLVFAHLLHLLTGLATAALIGYYALFNLPAGWPPGRKSPTRCKTPHLYTPALSSWEHPAEPPDALPPNWREPAVSPL